MNVRELARLLDEFDPELEVLAYSNATDEALEVESAEFNDDEGPVVLLIVRDPE